jgi:hypothetical protein
MTTAELTEAAHRHSFPCQPPAGSLPEPGACECGKTHAQHEADKALRTAIGLLVHAYGDAARVFGPRTIRHFPAVGHGPPSQLRWESCTRCSAGTQWWNGTDWIPFADHAKMVRDGNPFFEPKQANSRKCPHCQMGGWWRDEA